MKKLFVFLGIIILATSAFLIINSPSDSQSEALSPAETSNTPALPYQTISPDQALSLIAKTPNLVILDVRTYEEYSLGHLRNAILSPHDQLLTLQETQLPEDLSTPILLYCHSGTRSALAAETLSSLGYSTLYDLSGGLSAWPHDITIDDNPTL